MRRASKVVLLVSAICAAAAVRADDRLVVMVGLDRPKLFRRCLLGAVPAVTEQRDVVRASLPQMGSERGHHILSSCLLVGHGVRVQRITDQRPE